ncbi:MAG: DUF3341 domain-containing protein [Planctomycetota bacterium]|jgi:hypothetical protein
MSEIKAPFVAGYFDDPDTWMEAADAARKAGHKDLDGYMPYPVHGFDHNLGYKRSWIGRAVLTMLTIGAISGFFMQWWMMKIDWPQILAGKPYNSWPAFVVITFEGGILAGAITNFLVCLLVACRLLPRAETHVLKDELTDDTFALCIPVDGNGDAASLSAFLAEQGADDIALYVREESAPAASVGEGEEA